MRLRVPGSLDFIKRGGAGKALERASRVWWGLPWPFSSAGLWERAWGGAARGLLGVVVRARVRSLRMSRTEVADSPGKVAGACGAQGAGPCAGPRRRWNRIRAAGLVLPLLLGHLLALTVGGGAFYLEVRELEEKCFIQEIPDGTMVIGNYKTELYDPAMEKYQPSPQWINLFVFVKDPENKNLLSRQYGPQGSFTFTSQSPGEHQICLHLESIRFALFYGGKLAIHLDMQLGERTNDYTEFAANDKLTLLHLRIQKLVEQVEKIQKEQEHQRWREEHFRQTSESTNQRVLWWSILQTLILVATGVWQMLHLKSFFKAKKLV
ncbi:Transmembrane emp24 domain-containing protein 9 [Camelus dromedarius]|uniref:Transmembrane emp24 domain-containing protein 9 n=1 Tax=Camelus dromedarius TaxID=9838 RepID=A0A5N4CLC2_CAMDR|nr:transmembrane emp24 domain-containing protein 9-like isoform X2 [Camelus dromedarius]KAB1259736.1 Transmembrane emp24 domain-containing protein 9 [Camelus dromedarius]KAB1259737.1 Transmembrane emp24 domain-containing protein 9 [Camelus dromedarius]KAB1259738.1 Transmembrane emp24 domain-containing protein 9 [Camelus dromedarius]